MLGRVARQRADHELAHRAHGAQKGAALLTVCADDGDELLGVRHDCSPVSGWLLENKIGFQDPSLKPILFDVIHRLWIYIMLDAVTLDQLRTFIAAAEQGSFSAAGRKLRRAQSVVSQTLANLEGQLGVVLFDRSARYPTLTEGGRALLQNA